MGKARWSWVLMAAAIVAGVPPRSAADDCVGACQDPLVVSVADLVMGVNIALDNAPLSACPTFDATGDQRVTVNELLLGVRNATDGCGSHSGRNQCATAPPIVTTLDRPAIVLSTSGAGRESADPVLSCGCAQSPRTVWATYDATTDGLLQIRADAARPGQTLAVLSGACGATTEAACLPLDGPPVVVALPATAGTRYRVEVSTACDGRGGVVTVGADLCGDGITTGGEECDDGGVNAGDGCDSHCAFEGDGVIDTEAGCGNTNGLINLQLGNMGQLFTPSAGALSGVDVMLSAQRPDEPQSVSLQLRRDGLDGEVVAERTVTTSRLAGAAFYHFAFAAPATVVPGQIYALAVTTDGSNVGWIRSAARNGCPLVHPNGGGIAGGERLNGEDLVFRTYAAP